MKRVVNNAEVFHLYANQREDNWQDHARNSNDSCSFDGRSAYSYTTQIAAYVDLPKERRSDPRNQVVLGHCGMAGYSKTTSRHMSLLRDAFHGHVTKYFEVPVIQIDPEIRQVKGKPESVADHTVSDHLRNLCYLRQEAVDLAAERGGRSDQWANDRLIKWLEYADVFKLRRLLNDVDRQIYDVWVANGRRSSINAEVESKLVGPFNINELTPEEQRTITMLSKNSAVNMSEIFWGLWGLGKTLKDLQKDVEITPTMFNETLQELRMQWALAAERKAKQKHRELLSDSKLKKYIRMSPADRYDEWMETGNRELLEFRAYPTHSTRPVHEIWGLPATSEIFPKYPGGMLRAARLVNPNRISTTGGVNMSPKEFGLYWKRFLRPLWNVRFNEDMYRPLVRLLRYNKEHRISRAYRVDEINMRYGAFKIGCHIMVFDNLADVAHQMGLEPTKLRWRPACLAAPQKEAAYAS